MTGSTFLQAKVDELFVWCKYKRLFTGPHLL